MRRRAARSAQSLDRMSYFRRYLAIIGVGVAVAAGLRIALGVPTWITLGVLLIGWPLGGSLITADDDLPGGWSNPDGSSVPDWRRLWWWADLLLVRGALVVVAFAIEETFGGHVSPVPLAAAALMFGLGIPLLLRGIRREVTHAV